MTSSSRSPELVVGQTWAYLDARWGEHRYLAITELAYPYVYAISRQKKRTRILSSRFARGFRWSYCGHEGPGRGLPAFSDKPVVAGCLASRVPPVASMDRICAVGFGQVTVTRDDLTVWQGDDETRTLAEFEALAQETPGDWRIRFLAPSAEVLYQRQGYTKWVLTFRGMGFA